MSDEMKEVLTKDGRQVLYSPDEDAEKASDTEEWIASDTIVFGDEP